MNRRNLYFLLIGWTILAFGGCSQTKGNIGKMPIFQVPEREAAWIREGQPIEFEGEFWYPQDAIEVLLDQEVYLVGEHKGIQFFVEKADVRPYKALFTKFDRNKFRMYRKKMP